MEFIQHCRRRNFFGRTTDFGGNQEGNAVAVNFLPLLTRKINGVIQLLPKMYLLAARKMSTPLWARSAFRDGFLFLEFSLRTNVT